MVVEVILLKHYLLNFAVWEFQDEARKILETQYGLWVLLRYKTTSPLQKKTKKKASRASQNVVGMTKLAF